jgi:Xaa-Pro aminopeptidase
METPADVAWRGYSLAERDRRWQAIRERAAAAGLDCIFVPLLAGPRNLRPSSANARGNRADTRYLTQMDDAAIALPTDGRPPIVITDRGTGNDWLPETRAANRLWGPAMAQALLDLGMERGRIGVSGLRGGQVTHVRAFGGVVIHGAYDEVLRRLPQATFEDATDIVGLVRYAKSDEEIECLRRATAIAEAGIEEMVRVARPGVDEAVLYARVTERMLELGSENYHWALSTGLDRGESMRFTEPPIGRRLQVGTRITNEVSAIWGGMVAQEVQPILLAPTPDEWKPVIQLHQELFEASLAFMKPGTSFGDMIDFVNEFADAGTGFRSFLTMHGRGMGNDGPLLTSRARGERIRGLRLEKGNAWVFKPSTGTADERVSFSWGGDVVVTETGGELLSQRPHGLVSITQGA